MQFVKPSHNIALTAHFNQWNSCCRCPLQHTRRSVVLWKGYAPCDLLLIGEAPGIQEDVDGYPFVGPAGQELDRMWEAALEVDRIDHQLAHPAPPIVAITNTVCCVPPNTRAPIEDEVTACRPRLDQFIDICRPMAIVLIGDVAKSARKDLRQRFQTFEMLHPAFVLRQKTLYGQYFQQCVTVLLEAIQAAR